MDFRALAEVLVSLAEPRGYSYRTARGLVWRRGRTLTRMIQLQRSQWHPGVYVNFGVVPNSPRKTLIPTWRSSLSLRPSIWAGPHERTFVRCETDHRGDFPARRMRRPLEWLLGEVDRYMGDEDWVRRVVLDPECVESIYADRALKRWAKRVPRGA